jgi:hypothetical protein
VANKAGDEHCWDMAKNYFGSVLPMNRAATSQAAVSALRNDADVLAVVPWPADEDKSPWWLNLIHQEKEQDLLPIIIAGALPYGSKKPFDQIGSKALILGRMEFNESGEDCSFIVIEVAGPLSRARVIDLLKEQDLKVLSIVTFSSPVEADKTAHLIEIDGYVIQGDNRLEKVTQKLEESAGICKPIGGYPVPPVFRAGDTDPIESKASV